MKKLSLLILILVLIAPSAFAEKSFGDEMLKGKHYQKMVTELDLSEEQQEALKALRKKSKGMKESNSALQSEREKLSALMEDDSASDADILLQGKKLSELNASMQEKRLQRVLEVRKILNPEQRARFRELRAEVKGSEGMRRRGNVDGEKGKHGRFQRE